jgi:hypothetical protein
MDSQSPSCLLPILVPRLLLHLLLLSPTASGHRLALPRAIIQSLIDLYMVSLTRLHHRRRRLGC